jgi:5-(carboxyamino)imidazole ribonucleotide synthase
MKNHDFESFEPSSTIGIIGGGQLAQMLCIVAKRMNYRTVVWTGGLESPAKDICDEIINLPFDDESAIKIFTSSIDVATIEFENIPIKTLHAVSSSVELRPSAHAVSTCADRELEKKFLLSQEIPCAPFWIISSEQNLLNAMTELNGCGVLKIAAFGYDGKGQLKISGTESAKEIWTNFNCSRLVLEKFIPFERELSIMIARSHRGEIAIFDAVENHHRHHILDITVAPAEISNDVKNQAINVATKIVTALDYVGIMGIEFFLCSDGKLLVNEMAPRPHNSGHHTIDSCESSQFELQLRSVCGLNLGSTKLLTPAAMLNLLGDMWIDERTPPDWTSLLADGAKLHIYGKKTANGRRKMGHTTFLGNNSYQRACFFKDQLINAAKSIA